jgi:hypothetical protein
MFNCHINNAGVREGVSSLTSLLIQYLTTYRDKPAGRLAAAARRISGHNSFTLFPLLFLEMGVQ